MCTITIQKDLDELKKEKSIIAYKIINKNMIYKIEMPNEIAKNLKKYSSFYNATRYIFEKTKLSWKEQKTTLNKLQIGFSVFINKSDAITVIKCLQNISLKEIKLLTGLQLYKVKCSSVVNAGLWNYSGNSNVVTLPFDNFHVAEFKELEFVERIA